MARGIVFTAALSVGLALVATPAVAQRTNSGEGTGTAVSRDSGGDAGGAAPRSSGDSGSSAGASSGGASSSSWDSPPPRQVVPAIQAPERQQRGGSRGEGDRQAGQGSRAVPRGSSGGSSEGDRSTRSGGASGRTAGAAAESGTTGSDRAVSATGRSRDGRAQIGTAVDRRAAGPGNSPAVTYYSAYPYSRFFWPGYSFGLGYYYDPLWYDPFFYGGYSGAAGYGYGGGYYGGGGGYHGGYGSASYGRGPTGSLRLKIAPKDAEVHVDGYFAGVVDDFDGLFQKLTLEAGARRIEIRAAGYEPSELDVMISPGETVTYRGDLKRVP